MKTPEEKRWEEFVAHARQDAVAKIHQSALTVCISPPGSVDDCDVKQALEIGASILMDKPLVVVQMAGRTVPPGLRRAASHVVELEHDVDLQAGQDELRRKLLPVLRSLGVAP